MADIKSQFEYLVQQTEISGLKTAPVGGKILLPSTNEIENGLKALDIKHQRLPEYIEVYTDGFNNSPFFSGIANYLSFSDIDFTSSFGILHERVFFDSGRGVFIKEGEDLPTNQLYENNWYYLKLKSLFIDGLHAQKGVNQAIKPIISYHDEIEGTMVLISATKGTLKIGYPQQNPAFDKDYNLKVCYEMLVHSLAAKGFPELFKSEIYDGLKEQREEARMQTLISKLPIIIENSERNFEVYINNFSFDEIIDKIEIPKQLEADVYAAINKKLPDGKSFPVVYCFRVETSLQHAATHYTAKIEELEETLDLSVQALSAKDKAIEELERSNAILEKTLVQSHNETSEAIDLAAKKSKEIIELKRELDRRTGLLKDAYITKEGVKHMVFNDDATKEVAYKYGQECWQSYIKEHNIQEKG